MNRYSLFYDFLLLRLLMSASSYSHNPKLRLSFSAAFTPEGISVWGPDYHKEIVNLWGCGAKKSKIITYSLKG